MLKSVRSAQSIVSNANSSLQLWGGVQRDSQWSSKGLPVEFKGTPKEDTGSLVLYARTTVLPAADMSRIDFQQ